MYMCVFSGMNKCFDQHKMFYVTFSSHLSANAFKTNLEYATILKAHRYILIFFPLNMENGALHHQHHIYTLKVIIQNALLVIYLRIERAECMWCKSQSLTIFTQSFFKAFFFVAAAPLGVFQNICANQQQQQQQCVCVCECVYQHFCST